MKIGHFKAPSLPCTQTWAQASWPHEEPIEPGGLIWCYSKCRRNIKARNWCSLKQSTTYTGQPDRLDPWSCSEFNNEHFLRGLQIYKTGFLRDPKRLNTEAWKCIDDITMGMFLYGNFLWEQSGEFWSRDRWRQSHMWGVSMHPENSYKDGIKGDGLPSIYPSVTSQYPPRPLLFSPFLPYFNLVFHISFFSIMLIALAAKLKVTKQ